MFLLPTQAGASLLNAGQGVGVKDVFGTVGDWKCSRWDDRKIFEPPFEFVDDFFFEASVS